MVDEAKTDSDEQTQDTETANTASSSASFGFAGILALLSLLCALVSGAGVYWLWQQGQSTVSTQQSQQQQFIEQQKNLETELSSFKQLVADTQHEQTTSTERLTEMSRQLKQRDTDDDDWLLAEVSYLLQLAEHQLTFANNRQTAITLLENADKRLAQISGSQAVSLRREVQQYLAALKAIPAQDTIGLLVKLETLTKQVPNLALAGPIKRAMTNDNGATAAAKSTASGWQAQFNETLQLLGRVVVIRHHDEPVKPLMLPEQHQHLMLNVQAELVKAQWAVLHSNDAVYQTSLSNAGEWVKAHFDQQALAVQAFLSAIDDLKKHTLKPTWPDIRGAMQALAALSQQAKQRTGHQG